MEHRGTENERLAVRGDHEIRLIPPSDIIWVEAVGHAVVLHCRGGLRYRKRVSLTAIVDQLAPNGFVRTTRFAAVRASAIACIRPTGNGDYRVILEDGTAVRLTRRFWSGLKREFGVG